MANIAFTFAKFCDTIHTAEQEEFFCLSLKNWSKNAVKNSKKPTLCINEKRPQKLKTLKNIGTAENT